MLESLQPSTIEIHSDWDEEIERRLDAFDQGLMPTHSADAVFAEASMMRTRSGGVTHQRSIPALIADQLGACRS